MQRFLLKLTFFSATCFVLLNLAAMFYAKTSPRRVNDPGGEIYDAIKRSHESSTASTVVIGDSVAHQLLTGHTPPGMLNLATNQAISMCGQYLLAKTAIEHDPAIKEIILAYQPIVFINNLDQTFCFNYFVRPFYPHTEYRAGMSPEIMTLINRRPAARLVVLPLFRYTTLLFDIDYSQDAPKPTYTYLAPVSIDYLRKLADLCDQHKIRLRIVSTPISRDRNYDQAQFEKEVTAANLEKLFPDYTNTVRLVDPTQLVDSIHFKEDKIDENSAIFVKMLLEKTPAP